MLKQTDFFGGPVEPRVDDPLPSRPSDAQIASFAEGADPDTVLALGAQRLRRGGGARAVWAKAMADVAPGCERFGTLIVALDAVWDEPPAWAIGAEIVRRVQGGPLGALTDFEAESLASVLERAVWEHLARREPAEDADSLTVALMLLAGETRSPGSLGPIIYADTHATDTRILAAAREVLERRGVLPNLRPCAPDIPE